MTVDIREYLTIGVYPRVIRVGQESHMCDAGLPAGVDYIHWYPEGVSDLNKTRGVLQRMGAHEFFNEFSQLEPYLAIWQAAKADEERAELAAAEHAEAQQKAALEAHAATEASQKDRQKLYDALAVLGRTDHELWKVLEVIPAVREKLDPTLVEAREEARKIAKAEKARLGL